MSEANGRPQREKVELMAIQALRMWPRLAGELGIQPSHFRTDKKREALAEAIEGAKFWNRDGSVPLMDVAMRAGVEREWLAATFCASFNTIDEGRWWCELLAQAESEFRLRQDVENIFKDRHGPGLIEALAEVVARHQAVSGASNGRGPKSALAMVDQYVNDRMEALATGKSPAIPTGFPTLDKYFKGGWRRKEVTLLVAGAGVGKTTLADHFRRSLALRGYASILFSAEMSEEQLAERQAHASAGIPLEDELDMDDLRYVSRRIQNMEDQRSWLSLMEVDEAPEITPGRMVARSRARIAAGVPLAMVVADTLGKVRVKEQRAGNARGESRGSGAGDEYDRLTRGLMAMKPVAKAIPAGVLLLHHLREGVDNPTLNDIHGCKHAGREVDNAIAIWRPDPAGPTWCRILKARQTSGITHIDFRLFYNKRTQYYGESQQEVLESVASLPPRTDMRLF